MKIIITGSLGNISKPLTQELVKKGHAVTVISSNSGRQAAIEDIGATAAIGTIEDPDFLAATFKGAAIVYLMETINAGSFFDHNVDVIAANTSIGKNYKKAIEQSGVKQVIHLSSIGAHTGTGNGILKFHYDIENILQQLPGDVAIKFMRPVGFYYNMLQFIQTIKTKGSIISNYGGDEKEPWVSPLDIAAVIAEEMEKPFAGREIRYIASDEVSPNEIAKILGKAIGQPGLQWVTITSEELLKNMVTAGMNPQTARGFVEMNASRVGGVLYEDYYRHQPVLGKIKLTDYASTFAAVYNQP